jgi:NodT family efflux transporter outer membrane factor (OMF) lipoprotein
VRGAPILSAALLLVGCSRLPAVGPDYVAPPESPVAAWSHLAADSTVPGVGSVVWWEGFGDEKLNELVVVAFSGSFELQRAEARLREVRAARRIAAANFLPAVTALGEFVRRDPSDTASESPFGPAGTDLRSNYEAGFDATWEIDIFGGLRRDYEAATAEIEGAAAFRDGARLALVSEVVREYATMRALERRIAIAEQSITIQQESFEIIAARFKAGVSSELDLTQARTELETTRARVPALRSELVAARFRLGILVGETTAQIDARLGISPVPGATSVNAPLVPQYPRIDAVDTPSTVLRRRPDIQLAERELAAANARIGVAVADLFPRVDLAGAFGYVSGSTANLFERESRSWSFIPGIRWPIFSGGKLLAAVAVATERERQALAVYEEAVLRALADCEGAFVAYREETVRGEALRAALVASERALVLAQDLYAQGVVDFLRVIDAERTNFQRADELAQSEQALIEATVAIYKALGLVPTLAGGVPAGS